MTVLQKFSRDQWMMGLVALAEMGLGVEIGLAHLEDGHLTPWEWVPVVGGLVIGGVLLLAGWLSLKRERLAAWTASVALAAGAGLGLAGAYFHAVRAGVVSGSWVARPDVFLWAPPLMGPLAFVMLSWLGWSALAREDPPGSGCLRLWGRRWCLPYSKTRAYFFIVSLGILIAVVSSTLDHARRGLEHPLTWAALAVGVFAMMVAATMGWLDRPGRGDALTYRVAMLLLVLTGVAGSAVHIWVNLEGTIALVPERFMRGAPPLAPLLYTLMGLMGLLAMWEEERTGT